MADQQTTPQPSARAAPQLDRRQIEAAVARLRTEQNLTAGVLAGLAASLAGAAVWAVVTDATGYQIGWMAVGVGFIVGVAMRALGKGIDKTFGVLGAILALFGCILGNLLAVVGIVAQQQGESFMSVVGRLDLSVIARLMELTFSPMDLLFYGIAIYEGYKLSFRPITQQDLTAAPAPR
ncbi:MAG TPA: hypothetical protein VMU03_15845 [Gammaproteobacteria bacterium]|nr:hypothetical protein [Gammaproteobacteria bacterium]